MKAIILAGGLGTRLASVHRELDWEAIAGHLEDLYGRVGVHCA
ncbi:MAG TPA: hypothetical protein VM537_26300 [Anaerolineae bacterium]|nr:hypothetical protein [Anaerolineae bacterium]